MEHAKNDRTARALARLEEAGMTLIEIMIVLAIIALVMGFLVGPRVIRGFKDAKIRTAKLEVTQLAQDAFGRWMADNPDGACPSSVDELKAYSNNKTLKDPWGSKYTIRCGDIPAEDQEFGVISAGPDRKDGTEDDIHSWDGAK